MAFGPHGNSKALYYTNYMAQVRRIFYQVPGNQPPIAVTSASPLGGPLPLSVAFEAINSSDPDSSGGLLYFWDFGDGTPETITPLPIAGHTYTTAGYYVAHVRVR